MKKKKMLRMVSLVLVLVLAGGGSVASGQVLAPISSVTGFSGGDSYTPGDFSHLINGDGVSKPDPNDPSTWLNNGTSYGDEWYDHTLSSAANGKLAWVAFDLGSARNDLGSLYVFNSNYNTDNVTAQDYNVYYAVSPTVTLPTPPGANASVDYDFASGGWTLLTSMTVTAGGEIDTIDLTSIASAQYIGLEITSQLNAGDNRVGFDEVAISLVDINAPAISALSPTNNAASVAGDASFVAAFDENIQTNSGNVILTNLTDASSITIPITDSQVSVATSNLTINPTAFLDLGDAYAILIESNAIQDISGNAFAGISDTNTWQFTTTQPGGSVLTVQGVTGSHGGDQYANGMTSLTNGSGIFKADASDPSTWSFDGSGDYKDEWMAANLSGALNAKLAWASFDLGESISLERFYLFNCDYQSGQDGTQNYNLYYAGTPGIALPSEPAKNSWSSTGLSPQGDYDFSGSGWTKFNTSGVLTAPQEGIHTVDVSQVTARYVAVEILEDYGRDTRVGFDEVAITSVDATRPADSTFSPTNDATGVLLSANIEITFDENIVTNAGNVILTNLTASTGITIPMGDAQLSASGATLTLDPSAGLEANSLYAVLIDPGAVRDAAGNGYQGITETNTWNFTTVAGDFVAPLALSFNPTNTSTDVLVGANLVVTFDELIQTNTGNVIITNLTDETATSIAMGNAQVSVSGDTLTINPSSDLDNGDTYAVLIEAGAVEDQADTPNAFAGIADTNTWQFTATTDGNWSLVAYWPLTNSTVGTIANGATVATEPGLDDVIDNSDHPATDATSSGTGGEWVNDAERGIVLFTPDDHRLNAGTMGISNGEPFTWSLWVKTSDTGVTGEFPGDDASANSIMGSHGNTVLRFRNDRLDGSFASITGYEVSDGTWRHMVLRSTGSKAEVYIDGAYIGQDTTLGTANYYSEALRIGGSSRYNEDITGLITDVAIWTEALSPTRIAALAAGGPVQLEAVPPSIASLSPTNGATGITTTDNLILTFSETVQTNAGYHVIITNLTDSTGVSIPIGDAQLALSSNVFTINPTAPLELAKTYAVLIEEGAFEDTSFNGFSISDTTTWQFQTVAGDLVAPTIFSYSPANGAAEVPVGSDLVATFDEPVVANTGNITIRNVTDAIDTTISVLDPQVTVSGQTLTVNPHSNLAYGKTYAILLDAGVVEDTAGNPFAGIADVNTWRFDSDSILEVVTLEPANSAIDVVPDANLVITFDENITTNAGSVLITNLTDGTGQVIDMGDPQLSVSGATLTINPTVPLMQEKTYAVLVTDGIVDGNGTAFPGIGNTTTWQFTTSNDQNWSLVAYWPLDDGPAGDPVTGADDMIDDSTHPATDATANGTGGTWVDDPQRGIVFSTTSGDSLSAGSQGITGDFTWSLWIKTTESSENVIMGNRYGSSPWNKLYTTGMNNWATINPSGGWGVADGTWHHMAVRRSGSTVSVYIDGVQVGTPVSVSTDQTGPLGIGGDGGSERSTALISEVAIWKEALPVQRIQALAAGGSVFLLPEQPTIFRFR